MNLLVWIVQRSIPGPLKRQKLRQLFAATAQAFGSLPPEFTAPPPEAHLVQFARYTRQQVEAAIEQGQDLEALRGRLFQAALPIGRNLRRTLLVKRMDEVMAVGQALYRSMGIDFQGDPSGGVTITHCNFSGLYTPVVCRVISGLDEGVFAGLSGGGQLLFTARITEGEPCCRARLVLDCRS